MTCCMADRITVTLHELVSLIDTYAEGVLQRDHGMTFGEFRYLATLAELDGPDVTELARCMGLTKAAVSKRLPHLEGAGWVRRRADPAHGRRVILELTPEGATVVDLAGVRKEISLSLVDGVAVGDYVIVHVGYALNKLDPEEAEQTLKLFAEMGQLDREPTVH